MKQYSGIKDIPNCPYCSFVHPNEICPKIKKIEYYPNGTIKTIEFHETVKNQTNFLTCGTL